MNSTMNWKLSVRELQLRSPRRDGISRIPARACSNNKSTSAWVMESALHKHANIRSGMAGRSVVRLKAGAENVTVRMLPGLEVVFRCEEAKMLETEADGKKNFLPATRPRVPYVDTGPQQVAERTPQ